MDLRAQIDPNTVIVGDMHIPLSPIDKSTRQKINKGTSELIYMLDQMDIIHIYQNTMKYTLFSTAHGTFSKIDNILGLKASLNKFKKIEISPCIISDHSRIKPELKNIRNHRKYSNIWILNNTWLK
jgi:hypothetical protein